MRYDASKPLPVPDPESAPFWEAARNDTLVIQRCGLCDHARFPATTYCPVCRADNHAWIKASGRGRLFSWIVVHHPVPAAAYRDDVPYLVALVTLEEGPRIVTNLIDCEGGAIYADMPLIVAFVGAADGFKLPVFRPIRELGGV
jgi:uncharacterized OB-fold protein